MPVTWCYDVVDSTKKYCPTRFPTGCYVTSEDEQKDACYTNVSFLLVSRRVLEPCRLSVMELFCENSQRLKTVYDFRSKNSIVDVFQVPKYSFCGLQNISAGKNMLKIFENYSAQFTFRI